MDCVGIDIGKAWATRGRDGTPVFRHQGHWSKVNLIAAISPEGRLFFQTPLKDCDEPAVVEFLKHPLRAIEEYIILVWDNATIHRNKAVKEFLRLNADRIEAHFLPTYAFELMPVERFNAQLKAHELKDAAYRDTDNLVARVRRKARSIQRRRKLCRSFWGQTPLSV